MQYRPLGHAGLEVSAVAFGCWAIVGGFNWGEQDERDSLAALRAAYDGGVTFFDTAEGYGDGRSEQLLARALGDARDRIVIATKASPGHFRAADLRAACERSLRALGTDRIDLYQLHWRSNEVPLAETLGAMKELQAAGKVRAVGVSNFGVGDLTAALQHARIVTDQLCYSLLFRPVEHELLPLCRRAGVGLLCYSPLFQGLLTGKFTAPDQVPADRARFRNFSSRRPQTRHGEPGCEQETFAAIEAVRAIAAETGETMADVSLAWLLAQPGVTAVIAGGRNADQARRNTRAAAVRLSADVIARLAAATAPVKRALGPNADPWQGDSRVK